MSIKIERLKQKTEEYEERMDKMNDEFSILKTLYEDHLSAYETAIKG